MTQDEIIEMAREAGIIHPEMVAKHLETFANLVAAKATAKEREALAQEQEPIVGTKTWFEDGKVVTQHLTASQIYKEPDEEEYLSKAYRLANELRCHLATAPAPQRTWVGLTYEDIESWELPDTPTVAEFAWFVEAKLKERNT